MLKLELIQKSFGKEPILTQCRMGLEQGDRLAILGPSGIGKTTLLRIITGLDAKFDGDCIRPDHISLVFQNPTLLAWRTAADNLRIFHPKATEAQISHILDQVGLSDKSNHFPRQLSTGQQRRLALARAFLGQGQLVALDEAFASLDNSLRQEMIGLTKNLLDQVNSTMIMVTHDPEEARSLGARVMRLEPTNGSGATLVAQH